MITNTGKNILAKYLIGQAPAYASYIAVGCGAKPLSTDADLSLVDYSDKKTLDFEMFRVPITSRGYVTENNVSKVVLTAELPTEERYEISEIGIFSAGANTAAGAYDSKTVYAFTQDESWENHRENELESTAIPIVYTPLDSPADDGIILQPYKVFQTNSDNRIFTNQSRSARYERCRFFNNVIMMAGDSSNITLDVNNNLVIEEGSDHIHLTGATLDFNKNSPIDEIKFAFSIANKDGFSSATPDEVRILLEFASTDSPTTAEYARFQVRLTDLEYDFTENRYFVATKQLQELVKSNGFTWKSVDVVKIYSCVINNSAPSEDFFVCLDAIRFENKGTVNTLYGLTGYSVIKSHNSETIVKSANTTNYIEFRFAMDVQ